MVILVCFLLSPFSCLTSVSLNESLKHDVFYTGEMKVLSEAFTESAEMEINLCSEKSQKRGVGDTRVNSHRLVRKEFDV